MNKKKSAMNIATDIISKLVTLAIGIILPKLYIDSFGSEVNGLLSSVKNMLVYINLLEAGVGSASLQALYKAIGKKKQDDINGILAATDQFYKRTGLYFFAIVCVLAFLYPVCVDSEIGYFMVCILILMSAVPSAVKYFFQGKYTILLNADNKTYILNTLTLVFNIATDISKVMLIFMGYNVLLVQASYIVISVIYMVAIVIYVKRKYRDLDLSVRPDVQAISKKKYAMVHTISSTIFSNIDVLVLTFFTNLKIVSVYTIYSMVFIQLNQLLKGMSNGLNASFGQLYYVDRDRFKKMYIPFSVFYRFLVLVVMTVAGVMILPFLSIYTSSFKDVNYLDSYLPVLFLSTNVLDVIRWPEVLGTNTTGHFQETATAAILETAINLVCSIVFVIKFGIYGVLIATIVALLYRTLDMVRFVDLYILGKKYIKDFAYILLSLILSIGITRYSYYVVGIYTGYLSLIFFAVRVSLVVGIIHLACAVLFYPGVYCGYGKVVGIACVNYIRKSMGSIKK